MHPIRNKPTCNHQHVTPASISATLTSRHRLQVYEWVLEKVDGLAAQWKDNPEATPEDSQQLADVDLFALNEGATALRVHPVWLNHLQVLYPPVHHLSAAQ